MAAVKNVFHNEISSYCPDHGSACHCAAEEFGLHFDRWTGDYRGQFNDVWVSRPHTRKMWIVAFRDRGNVTRIVSRHRDLRLAFAAAAEVIAERSS